VSQQRYTPEFKDEAVRQVTEKGHSVQEVAARLLALPQLGEVPSSLTRRQRAPDRERQGSRQSPSRYSIIP
jgi:transposase-like protein